MSVKSSTELMLYVVLTMPTLNKAYLFIYLLCCDRTPLTPEAEVMNLFTENVTFFTLYILCAQFKRFCKWRQAPYSLTGSEMVVV
jgi:hypothetical protein